MRMRFLKYLFVSVCVIGLMVSCIEKEPEHPWNPGWNEQEKNPEEDPEEQPGQDPGEDPGDQPGEQPGDNPGQEEEPETPVPGVFKGKPRYIWIDAAANFQYYANDKEYIAADLAKVAKMGFTDVIVDVRPTNSGVLFKSNTEAALKRVDAWTSQGYVWINRTADFDYLQTFIEEGHKVGLRVNASINTMVGGCMCPYGLGYDGFLFNDPSKKDWAVVINTDKGVINTMDQTDRASTRFLNPANDAVVNYLLNLLGELASYKDLDGIVLDRCRYSDDEMLGDFSLQSKEKFEKYLGKTVENWPGDIFAPGQSSLSNPVTEMQKKWMSFRAKMIHDFVEKASNRVHSVNSKIRFGCYVGGWYNSYYPSGVNWAHPTYNARNNYKWALDDYSSYGYADHCDFMFIGAYAGTKSIWGSGEWTMQGFCKQAGAKLAEVPYAGGPDIGNGSGFENGGQGNLMPDIVNACINSSDGLFIFDLCHVRMYDYWDDFERAIDKYLETL